jgi:carboxyl-terminal processing protease
MKYMTRVCIWSFILVLLPFNTYSGAQELSTPEKNFEHLWKVFDEGYALFTVKHIDWKALYHVYRPLVTSETNDDELFEIMSDMLGHLNDNHVSLHAGHQHFCAGILQDLKMEDFSLELIQKRYLQSPVEYAQHRNFTYGWLTNTIGYFHFRSFGTVKETRHIIDTIMKNFSDAEGLVVDVRDNTGGDDRVGKLIADRFADRKRLYMTTQLRYGDNNDDFMAPLYWYVEPDGPKQFTKPVIVLTHRHSISAAENFVLAMRVLPHVTIVGETTSGAFADQYGDTLPNGWRFSLPFNLFLDFSGFCWEGLGVPPDLRMTNRAADIHADTDRVLEFARRLLETGHIQLQQESGSLVHLEKESLIDIFVQAVEEKGLKNAVEILNKARFEGNDLYFLNAREAILLAQQYVEEGKIQEAIAVLKICLEEFPEVQLCYSLLAMAYAMNGEQEFAHAMFEKAHALPGRLKLEREVFEEAQTLLMK